MTVASLPSPLPPQGGDAGRWVVSALMILLLHAAAMVAALSWQLPVETIETTPPAIMIELAPEPVARPAPAPLPPPPPPEPPKAVEPPPPSPPEPEPSPPPAPAPAVTLPVPPPRPPPKPRPVQRRIEPPPVETSPPPAYAPPPPAAAPPQPVAPPRPAPPPVAPPPSANVLGEFQRSLLTHLERAKRYPREAQLRSEQGTVYLRFRMDRSGRVLSAGIDRSSGYPDLDAEVLDMINRAQPLPQIPPAIAQNQLELSVPVRFSLR